MAKSDAATAGEQQEQWISDLIADRTQLRKESLELLGSIGRKVKEIEALNARLATLEAETLNKTLENIDFVKASSGP